MKRLLAVLLIAGCSPKIVPLVEPKTPEEVWRYRADVCEYRLDHVRDELRKAREGWRKCEKKLQTCWDW